MPSAFVHDNQTPVVPATAPQATEDLEMEMAINASIQSALQDRPTLLAHPSSEASSSVSLNNSVGIPVVPSPNASSECAMHETGPEGNPSQPIQNPNYVSSTQTNRIQGSIPSAPPIANDIVEDGPIHYPAIDFTPVDISSPITVDEPARAGERKEDGVASSCVICLDAPVEGACIPCGHMAGCMSCLNEIQAKKWGCPVCRAKIDQVIRLYAV